MALLGDPVRLFGSAGIEFILVGGIAAAVHGSPRATQDVDVVYRRTTGNLNRLVDALGPYHPHLRGAPPGLAFHLDLETLRRGCNFPLVTDLGWIDLLGEILGGGTYEELVAHSILEDVFGVRCYVTDLDTLIRMKRLAGRPRDFEVIAELELLRDRSRPAT
ncbi:MAG: hypothetical protein ACLP59_16860 [Bryobacteraceae bacterium]